MPDCRIEPGTIGKPAKQGRYGRGPTDRAVTSRPDGVTEGQRAEDERTKRLGSSGDHELEPAADSSR